MLKANTTPAQLSFSTQDIEEALKLSKAIAERSEDKYTTTSKLVFHPNGPVAVSFGKKGDQIHLSPTAMEQICQRLKVPSQFVRIKREMKDTENLVDVMNRHAQRLESRGVLVRMWDTGKEGKIVRAVFPDNAAVFDMEDALKAVRSKLSKFVKEWGWIHVNGFTLRVNALFNLPAMKNKPTKELRRTVGALLPCLHIGLSEDGGFPITASLGIHRVICTNMATMNDARFPSFNFRRVEKEEGGLNQRFRQTLMELRSKAIPAYRVSANRLYNLAERSTGKNRENLIETGSKMLKYPVRLSEQLQAAWEPREDSLFGYWNALTRTGQILTEKGTNEPAMTLQHAAGRLQASPDSLHALLVGASAKEKTNDEGKST